MPQAEYFPPAGFNFSVSIDSGSEDSVDARFQEVSGITMELLTEKVEQTSGNDTKYKPKETTYSDLVLKRGLITAGSDLATWCQDTIQMLSAKVQPKDISVNLLDVDGDILMSWSFENAFPTKWEISSFNAQKSAIVTETMTFKYSAFRVVA